MNPPSKKSKKIDVSIEDIRIPTDSSKGTPDKSDTVLALWVFQNCAGDKEKKLRRIVSLVRTRNSIDWLPVTSDGKICIVTFLGEFSNLIKLRSSVFGLGTESFSFKLNDFWIIPPNDLSQFTNFFELVQSDLQAQEKRLLQKREIEIKTKAIKVDPAKIVETDSVELTETDIEDLRKELNAISSI